MWRLAALLLLLLCQTAFCKTPQNENIGVYIKKFNREARLRWNSLRNSHFSLETNTIPAKFLPSHVLPTTVTSNPTQSPTLQPTSTTNSLNGNKYSAKAKITVALGVLAIVFIAVVLIIFLCGRYVNRSIRESQYEKNGKVHPTLELRGIDADFLGSSHPPAKLDYSEYLRLRIVMDSAYNANAERKEREYDKGKDKQEERRRQIENMIATKINESQSMRSSKSFNISSASKYCIADAEVLDLESSIPMTSRQ
jgi:hypothetical protein